MLQWCGEDERMHLDLDLKFICAALCDSSTQHAPGVPFPIINRFAIITGKDPIRIGLPLERRGIERSASSTCHCGFGRVALPLKNSDIAETVD
jgi:hypothetical protein